MRDGRKKKAGTSSLAVESVGRSPCSLEEGLPIPRSTAEKFLERFLSPDAFRPFQKGDLANAVPDLLTVSFYPKERIRWWRRKPWKRSTFRSTLDLGLSYEAKVQYARAGLLTWRPPLETGVSAIEQNLDPGWNGSRLPCLTQAIHLNALRFIRGRRGKDIVPQSDNFIEDGNPADIRREVLAAVVEIVSNARIQYLDLLRTVFEVELGLDDIETVVDVIEIAIDVPCKYAFHAPTRWTDAWTRKLKGCWIRCAEVRWLLGEWFDSEQYKLYAKAFNRLRFEYRPNKDRMTEILGHVMRVSSHEALAHDLDALGKEAFARLLDIQREVDTRDLRVVGLDTFIALMEPKTRTAWSKIAPALLADDRFFNAGSDDTCLKLLNRLSRLGLVEHLTRGHWRATRTFSWFLRGANVLFAPHALGDRRIVDEHDVAARNRGRMKREGRS